VEAQAKVLCWDRMRHDAGVVEEGASRLSRHLGTRTVQAMDSGCGRPIASGKERVMDLGHMRGIGTKELARLLESVAGMKEQERRLVGSFVAAGMTVQGKVLESMLGN
jgi:hypothetical protein